MANSPNDASFATGPANPTLDLELVRALERHSARAWPSPEVVILNGWELRFAPGSRSRRVNGLTPVMPVPGKFPATLSLSQKLCAERAIACNVRTTPMADAEVLALLDEQGFVQADTTSVQISAIGTSHGLDTAVTLQDEFDADWVRAMCAASGNDEDEQRVIARILQSVAMPQVLAIVVENGEPVCFGRGVAGDGLLGIFHIVTRSDARRRGHALRLVSALMGWGRKHAAMRAYLQVVSDNLPARTLYEGIGFREAYTYSYWSQPKA